MPTDGQGPRRRKAVFSLYLADRTKELEYQNMLLSGLHNWRQSIRSRISRRKALHKAPGCFNVAARVEQLEDRILLTVSTPVLGSGADLVFIGDGGADSILFSVSNGGLLAHNLGGSFGFNSNSDLDSVTAGDQTRLVSDLTIRQMPRSAVAPRHIHDRRVSRPRLDDFHFCGLRHLDRRKRTLTECHLQWISLSVGRPEFPVWLCG